MVQKQQLPTSIKEVVERATVRSPVIGHSISEIPKSVVWSVGGPTSELETMSLTNRP